MYEPKFLQDAKIFSSSACAGKVRIAVMVSIFFIFSNLFLVYAVEFYYRYHNERVQFGYRLPNKLVLIRKELPSVFHFIEENKSKYDKNIILLGDSVAYGAGNLVESDENVGQYLENDLAAALPGQKVKVWNLAIPGSKPGDTYFLYKKALELKPDLILINLNYIFYTPANVESPLAHYWLAPDFDPDGRYGKPVEKLLYPDFEHRLKFLAYRYIPIYRYRDLVNALVFKDQPGGKFQAVVNSGIARLENLFSATPARAEDRENTDPPVQQTAGKKNEWFYQDWSKRLPGMAWMYNNTSIDPKTNIAYLFTREIAEDIEKNNIPAVIFMAGQNHKMLKPLIDNSKYRENNERINQLFAGQNFYLNFDNKIDDSVFVDNVHLTAAGNKILAERLTGTVLRELDKEKALEK